MGRRSSTWPWHQSRFDESHALTSNEYKAFRRKTAHDEAPCIAGSVAVIIALFAVLNSRIGTDASIDKNFPTLMMAVVMTIAALIYRTRRVPASIVPWTAAALAVLLVWALLVQENNNFSSTGLAYSLFVVATYAPITLDFVIAVTAAIPMFIGCVLVSMSLHSLATSDWIFTSLAAFFISLVLLWARIRGVDDLARALAQQAALATRDPLTKLFNRHGLEDRTEQLLALAARQGTPVAAMFIDINRLKLFNDTNGHEAGDALITAIAQAIRAVVRAEDLACRWGGDEFVVIGLGTASDPDTMQNRISDQLNKQHLGTAIWTARVTVGCAAIDPRFQPFDELIRNADADMYRRKSKVL
ncbi:MAG: GGDEF domain-containing protein [Actinomycetota bacterium]|nr:GGDEF domain-containing protein [Actinomycetota bacterium]